MRQMSQVSELLSMGSASPAVALGLHKRINDAVKKEMDYAKVMEKVKREIRAFSISQYPELEVEPVANVPSHKQFIRMKRKEKKLFSIQAVLFGRDLLTR